MRRQPKFPPLRNFGHDRGDSGRCNGMSEADELLMGPAGPRDPVHDDPGRQAPFRACRTDERGGHIDAAAIQEDLVFRALLRASEPGSCVPDRASAEG